MGVWRKWIFPIIRILIFAAVAAALVKLAFFADVTKSSDPAVATGQITEPQVAVATGTIKNDVKLKGVVSADAAVPVKATLAGEIRKVMVSQGQHVDAATPVVIIRQEVPAADGSVGYKTVTVTAGAAGVLSSLPVIVGQLVTVGEAVGQVAPPSFSVSGTLDPAQQYRLLNQPTEAQVAIAGGPAPFTCAGLTISSALAGAGSGTDGGADGAAGSAASGTTVRCSVPADIRVFGGLSASITISGGVSANALIVPVTAVEGNSGTGNVYLIQSDGSNKKAAVTLGLSDGKNVEVTGGVKAGDQVLQFVPGAASARGGQG